MHVHVCICLCVCTCVYMCERHHGLLCLPVWRSQSWTHRGSHMHLVHLGGGEHFWSFLPLTAVALPVYPAWGLEYRLQAQPGHPVSHKAWGTGGPWGS